MVADTLARTVTRLIAESDSALLQRFVAGRDETAFAQIVRRHGPMVFGVCRRMLGHQQDAEDAFQATFLVLSRKAPTIRADGLGRWLHGVAVRVAGKARGRRRAFASTELNELPGRPAPPPADWLPLVDAALARLPERDRGPIVLCDLLGRSRSEAAAELGIGEGTLSSRLARAREKLRTRLTRLGVVPVVLTVAALAPEPVPAALIESTRMAAPPAVRELAHGVMRSMALTKLSQLAAGFCVAGTIVAGLAWLPANGAGPTPTRDTPKDPSPEARKPARSDAERFKGTWVIESARRNGSTNTDPGWADETMTFDGNALKFSRLPGRTKLYKLDPGWDQKHIDFECQQVPDREAKITVHIPAIYRFEGDKLHLVVGVMDLEDRPESFDPSPSGPPFTHVVLRRPGAEVKELAAEERKDLEGTWVLREVEHDGQRISLPAPATRLTFLGDRFTLWTRDGEETRGTFTVDVTPSPRHIDLKITTGRPESVGKVLRGVYTRNRNELQISIDETNKGRPPTLDKPKGYDVMYFVAQGSEPKPAAPAPKATGGRLRELQQERVRALTEQLQGQFERVKIGKDPMIQYLQAVRELGEAELEIAETRAARLAAVEKMVKELREAEDMVVELNRAGLQTKQGVAQTKAARLKAEIELEKLKVGK